MADSISPTALMTVGDVELSPESGASWNWSRSCPPSALLLPSSDSDSISVDPDVLSLAVKVPVLRWRKRQREKARSEEEEGPRRRT